MTDMQFDRITLPIDEQHTFIVTLPNNVRREVKAHYMDIRGGCLYFEDDNHDTTLVYAPGSWVWAEKAEDETKE